MEKLIEITNMNVKLNNRKILDNVSLTFFKGVSVFITGSASSGKTTFFKEIAKRQDRKIKKGVILEDTIIESGTVKDVLTQDDDYNNVADVIAFLGLDKVWLSKCCTLSYENMTKLLIAKYLIQKVDILFIDRRLQFLKEKERKRIIEYINKRHVTSVYSSSNIEDSLYFPYMVVLDKGIVAIEGKTMQVLAEEKLLKRLGIGLPFIIDLSIQLKLYGLVDKVYSDKRKLGKYLWK